ncbi:exocyst subunit [Rhodotorula toruloides]
MRQADCQKDEGDFDPVSLALHLLEPARRGNAAERDPPRSANGTRQNLPCFLRLKGQLDHAIRSALSPQLNPTSSENAYRAYESAITTHNATLGALTNAQKMIAGMRTGLGSTREKLEGTGREGLADMYTRMGMLEEMGGMLDEIDSLMRLPPSLEASLAKKRFLGAVVLLVRSIKALHKPEMLEIGALSDLRAWAVAQEGVVREILIEELHSSNLKSFYCDVRWKSYARGQTQMPLVDFGEDAEPTPSASASREPNTSFQAHSSGRSTARLPRLSKLQRFLQNLTLKPSGADPALDEAFEDLLLDPADAVDGDDGLGASLSLGAGEGLYGFGASATPSGTKARREAQKRRNPELDSFSYIEMLIESLAALGKLGYALGAVGQRVQGEMFALVEATIEEVEERGSSGGKLATEGFASLLRLSASETNTLASSVETLRDLFWILYSKLDAVPHGFKVSYEVASRISERRDFNDASIVRTSSCNLLFSLLEVWKSVQRELDALRVWAQVRALLHDYLTDDQSGTVSSRNPIVSVNEVLRFPRPRDGSKQVFRFAELDLQASHKLLKDYEDALNMAIKAAVPGLITDGSPSTTTTSALIVASTNPSAAAGRSTGLNNMHQALVPDDAFDVIVLFGPTLAFLDRVKEVMPGGLMGEDETSASTGFNGSLDEFVLRTFLPQLKEKVAGVFHQAVGGFDAFQEDPIAK